MACAMSTLHFARIYELNHFIVYWGAQGPEKDRWGYWWLTISAVGVVVFTVAMAVRSRRARLAMLAAAAFLLPFHLLSFPFFPHWIRKAAFIPLIPGWVAAVSVFGVHGGGGYWAVACEIGTNLLVYSLVFAGLILLREHLRTYRGPSLRSGRQSLREGPGG